MEAESCARRNRTTGSEIFSDPECVMPRHGLPAIGLLSQHRIFSHPDYTVGFGFPPNLLSSQRLVAAERSARGLMPRWHLPPVGNWPGFPQSGLTTPRKSVASFFLLVALSEKKVKIDLFVLTAWMTTRPREPRQFIPSPGGSSALRIIPAISDLTTGFIMKPLMPMATALLRSILSLNPVQMMTGTPGLMENIWLAS